MLCELLWKILLIFTTYVVGARNLTPAMVLILTVSVLCGKLLCSENRLRLSQFCFYYHIFVLSFGRLLYLLINKLLCASTVYCNVILLITGVLCQQCLLMIVLLNPSYSLIYMHPFISEQAQHVNHHLAVLKLYILCSLSPD